MMELAKRFIDSLYLEKLDENPNFVCGVGAQISDGFIDTTNGRGDEVTVDVTEKVKRVTRDIANHPDQYVIRVSFTYPELEILTKKDVGDEYLIQVYALIMLVDIYERIAVLKKLATNIEGEWNNDSMNLFVYA